MGEALVEAIEAGAVGWTHLGNAAPAIAPKFENVIFHALAQSNLMPSLIPDGIHIPPHAFRAMARMLNKATPPRLLLTTDAMAGAGAKKPGKYTLGEIQAEVGADGSARLAGKRKAGRIDADSLSRCLLGRAHGRHSPRTRLGRFLHAPRIAPRPQARRRRGKFRRLLSHLARRKRPISSPPIIAANASMKRTKLVLVIAY